MKDRLMRRRKDTWFPKKYRIKFPREWLKAVEFANYCQTMWEARDYLRSHGATWL